MRCPVCRAADNQGAQCRRCKADLGLLWQVQHARRRLLQEAATAAAQGRALACRELAVEAHRLLGDDESLRLLALAALLQRDFARAFHYWRAVANKPQ
jgi:hypothetical protein